MLSIATVIFTYNRPEHTKLVLDALENNDIHPDKLIIYQDGKKEETDKGKWNAVNGLINNIKWCEAEIVISPVNKGLAKSIAEGITEVLKQYDAVIVLEDDCVTHPKFMSFMVNALNKYIDDKRVFHINGYSWKPDIEPNGYDAYFCGRAGSWGWATWKNRWKDYKEDYKILTRIRKDEYAREQLYIWGMDLEKNLHGNINGSCDSWATFWALCIIEQHGYCLSPYKSLVNNIGFDGTGVHCGLVNPRKTTLLEQDKLMDLNLPEIIEFPLGYKKIFSKMFKWVDPEKKTECYYRMTLDWLQLKMYSGSVADYFDNKNIEHIAIWGTGVLCNLLLEELDKRIHVACLIESNPSSECYHNIPVKRVEELNENVQLIIVIPVYDMADICERIEISPKRCKVVGLDELIKQVMADESRREADSK